MTLTWEVLIPAYNAEATIGAAVASALAQEPRPERVLVYSDGSTDETVRSARAAGAEVIAATENNGVGSARQALLEHATAPWFLVLDADDRLLPDAGRHFERTVATHPDAWVLGFGATTDPAESAPTAAHRAPGRPVTLRDLWLCNPFISSSALIRRDPAVRAGGFPPVRRLVDYAFWLELAGQPDAGRHLWNHTAPVTVRAIHGGTITGNVVGAVLAERQLLLDHAQSALAQLPAPVRGPMTVARLCVLWWRGLSRHIDYGRPASSYLPPGDVVPGVLLPRILRLLALDGVRRALRWGAAAARWATAPSGALMPEKGDTESRGHGSPPPTGHDRVSRRRPRLSDRTPDGLGGQPSAAKTVKDVR